MKPRAPHQTPEPRPPRLTAFQRRLQRETKRTPQEIALLYQLAMRPHVGREQ